MNEENILEILEIILNKIVDRSFVWRLEGSANLKIQGINTSIRDLDITTNSEGIEIFRKVLNEFVVKDFFSEKINGQSLICDINGFEVEIDCYSDREKDRFDKIEIVEWNDLDIPTLPLKYALEFYKLIEYGDKVKLIENFLSSKK